MSQQVRFFVDLHSVQLQAQDFFMMGWESFSECQQVEHCERLGQPVQRWAVAVSFEQRLAFVTHALQSGRVFRVQESQFAVSLSSF